MGHGIIAGMVSVRATDQHSHFPCKELEIQKGEWLVQVKQLRGNSEKVGIQVSL